MNSSIIHRNFALVLVAIITLLTIEKSEAQTIQLPEADTVFLIPSQEQSIGYGKIQKDLVSSSIYSISGEELLRTRATSFLMALQGRFPGVNILQIDGEPGKESFNSNIRGVDSQNNSSILFMIDGIERSPNAIDLNEIERVTVLKDGAATAVYGMRGAGGVILIDTKRGFSGKSKISISLDQSFQSPTMLPEFVSAYDYANMYNQRVANDTLYEDAQSPVDHSATDFYSAREIERYRLADSTMYYPVRDMVDEFMRDYSTLTRFNINFQGGGENMKYFTSVGILNQSGLFENDPFDLYSYDAESKTTRFNFRSNIDLALGEYLSGWVQIGGSLEKTNAPFIGAGQSWDFVLAKLYETPNNAHNDLTPDGEVLVKRDRLNFRNTNSVYGYLNRTGSLLETRTRLGNTFGLKRDLSPLVKGLSVSGQLAFDVNSYNALTRSRSYEAFEVRTLTASDMSDSLAFVGVTGTSNSTLTDGVSRNYSYSYTFQGRVDYTRTFESKHQINSMLLAEQQRTQSQILLPSNYATLSGRLNYALDNKYLAEVSFAYQGTEQYAKNNRFGFFPAISLGWIASNESFLNVDAIDYLKVKASVGAVGNNAYGYGSANSYLFLTTWNANGTENQIGNPRYQWETFVKYNIGLEAQLVDDFFVAFDAFYHDNKDIVIGSIDEIPTGFLGVTAGALPPGNIGLQTNQGFEIAAGYTKSFANDLSLNITGNISHARNERVDVGELPLDNSYAFAYRREGYALGTHFGYKTDGLFNTQAEIDNWADQSALGGTPIPGDIKYVDLNDDNLIDERDIAPLGNGNVAETTFGLNLNTSFKGFDLSVFFTGALNRNVYLQGFGRWSNRDNFTTHMKDAWTEDNQNASFPRLGNRGTNFIKSDYWIEDGSFIRMKNIEMGYTLPSRLTDKINASSIRVYVNGLNLLTFHNLPNDDFDPETANSSNIGYPIIKAINTGINMKF
ncbi:SusC/RagA family TonB-linked outer membrane protein [Marinoscillum furvescens]|uniref:TonB-linked SusC/RagA family outer membrane protein n=1 Tax=Marinoscillum furvescens DSM 4134 TaxID=1122208 RepID=A0A3D9L2W9_MARFU|nr:SusC/RagA family TonB-linked outer membrane protein [Marinoscillum furvescens]RED98356.1 TonB-linked SusC/RagA family outer membrane protein [Marinoscillum furvescens DSM 4134]